MKLRSQTVDLLSPESWEVADRLYTEFDVSSGNLQFEKSKRKEFTKRFIAITGQHISDLVLVTAVISRRKAGLLPKIGRKSQPEISGFSDMDEVG